MKIIAHRGLWTERSQQNTITALVTSVKNGFGFETDVRDFEQKLVVSHDPPVEPVDGFELVIEKLKTIKNTLECPLFLNVKASGLAGMIYEYIKELRDWEIFLFDMALPDHLQYLNHGLPCFSRMSEIEPMLERGYAGSGIWLDSFYTDWWTTATIEHLLDQQLKICVVSPELHLRSHLEAWRKLYPYRLSNNIYLCTDFVFEANEFFK